MSLIATAIMLKIILVFSPIIILLYLIWQRKSTKPSRWKYPPRERILQFVFAYTNLISVGPMTLLGGITGAFFIVLPRNIEDFSLAIAIVLLSIASLISLFRPKFTFLIFICYSLPLIGMYLNNPMKDKNIYTCSHPGCVPWPDPKINHSTLLGIDSDQNDIRDDVQNYIIKNYYDNKELLEAMKQYARRLHQNLKVKDQKELSILITHEKLKISDCIYGILSGNGIRTNEAFEATNKVRELYMNTRERVKAAEKISSHFHGQSFSLETKEESCLILKDNPQTHSLLGFDLDDDGVRDDVQVWIDKNYGTNATLKMALRKYAQSLQSNLSVKDDKQASIAATKKALKSHTCLFDVSVANGNTASRAIQLAQTIGAFFANTKDRIDANAKIDAHFSGQTFDRPPKEEACNF